MSSLNPNIAAKFKIQFKEHCISLLLEGYESLKDEKGVRELSENNITARLMGFIDKNPKRKTFQISVIREAYHDTEEIYEGEVDADKSPRIDMKYITWNGSDEYTFHLECKNLAENNWIKSTSATVDANALRKRYISTGIQNFVSGRYPLGCLVGYVLEGRIAKIVEKVNAILSSDGRKSENLKSKSTSVYSSTHSPLVLEHYFLTFQ